MANNVRTKIYIKQLLSTVHVYYAQIHHWVTQFDRQLARLLYVGGGWVVALNIGHCMPILVPKRYCFIFEKVVHTKVVGYQITLPHKRYAFYQNFPH